MQKSAFKTQFKNPQDMYDILAWALINRCNEKFEHKILIFTAEFLNFIIF